jgi:RimJ/RimL family protein N-acetyltransferase
MEALFDNYTIRRVCAGDLPAFFSLIDNNRGRLEDFFPGTVAASRTYEDTRQLIANVTAMAEQKTFLPYVIVDNGNGALIAYLQIKSIDWNIPKAEIGYCVDAQYEGKGVTSKAVALLVKYAFDELKIHKLLIRTHDSNIGSRKVAEKNGFILEGTIKCDHKTTSGEIVDLMYYGLVNPIAGS